MKNKKIIASALAGVTMFSIMAMPGMDNLIPDSLRTSITADAATIGTIKTINHVQYDLYTNESGIKCASVCGYDGTITTMTIPNTVTTGGNTYTVCEIKDSAFSGSNLKKVYLQNATGLKKIGKSAFEQCDQMNTVYLSASVEEMGTYTFFHCDTLSTVQFASNYVLKVLPDNTFNNCRALRSITLPDSLIAIGGGAFDSCTALQSITIPKTVTSIGYSAFSGCTSLQRVLFQNSEAAINFKNFAFEGCTTLASISIPNKTKVIPGSCFAGCTSLSSVKLPTSLQEIGGSAFKNCSAWKGSITLGATVKTIGDEAFRGCSKITKVTMSDSVTQVGGGVFFGCTALSSVKLSNNITKLNFATGGSKAETARGFFGNCKSLTTVQLPVNCGVIYEGTFSGCDNMQTVSFMNDTATTGTYMKTIDGVLYSKDGTILLYCPQARTKTSHVISASVQTVRENAFDLVKNLQSITVKGCNTKFKKFSFVNCTKLTSMTVPTSHASLNPTDFIDIYRPVLSGTHISRVNGSAIVNTLSDHSAIPTFSSKYNTFLRKDFDKWSDLSFIRVYIEEYANYVVKNYTSVNDTELQKAKKLHDWLVKQVEYDSVEFHREVKDGKTVEIHNPNPKNHVDGSAFLHDRDGDGQIYTVCDGYARAYKILLNAAGIEAYRINATNTSGASSSGHAWNLVKIGGNIYHVDACWDDANIPVYFYFMKTDAEFAENHSSFLSWNTEEDRAICSKTGIAFRSTKAIGDLNQDGFYDQSDVDILAKICTQSIKPTADQIYAADVNMDGSVDITDIIIMNKIVGTNVLRKTPTGHYPTLFAYYVSNIL